MRVDVHAECKGGKHSVTTMCRQLRVRGHRARQHGQAAGLRDAGMTTFCRVSVRSEKIHGGESWLIPMENETEQFFHSFIA